MALLVWIAICFLPSLTGVLFTSGAYYLSLRKPSFSPPRWVFGPVWTVLYLTMGVAAWLVYTESPQKSGWAEALTMMFVQLALNALWTPLFFGLYRMDLALLEILALWIAIAATIVLFFHQRPLAGILLVPYLAWVSFAAYLNFRILQLNPRQAVL